MWYAHVFERNNIKRKRTALHISVPYINDNSTTWLPFNTSRIELESGEVGRGKPFFRVSLQFTGFQCLYPDPLWSEREYHPTDHEIE